MATETSQTLDRGLLVLEVLAKAEGGRTVTQIAQELGISRTVVYRLLAT
ncbi:MAG: HTH domain-containing protein, partial [Actinobacteria bacterium]|nr:HTH domain-containing protein [Actinomycetota bacterium]